MRDPRLGCGGLSGHADNGDPIRCEWGSLCERCIDVATVRDVLTHQGRDVQDPEALAAFDRITAQEPPYPDLLTVMRGKSEPDGSRPDHMMRAYYGIEPPTTCPTCGSDGPVLAYHARLDRWVGDSTDTVRPCRDSWHGMTRV